MSIANNYSKKCITPEEATAKIKSDSILAIGMAIGQPPALLRALADRIQSDDIKNLKVYYKLAFQHISDTLYQKGVIEKINANSFFLSPFDKPLIKRGLEEGRKYINFVPSHFSRLPSVFSDIIKPDAFMVTVSPMDKGGFFSLGTNNDYTSTALRSAKYVMVEVNKNMPRVFGQSQVHIDEVDAIIENDQPLMEFPPKPISAEEEKIAMVIAKEIPDGATLQLGIGALPAAIVGQLKNHKDLGVHTELLSNAFIDLIKQGVITNKKKTLHPYKNVFTLALGDRQLYDFMDDNASFESYPSSYVNDPYIIGKNDNLISVNSAIEVDLYGQINAEFIGGHQYSGSGGQFDFIRGSIRSKGGKSFVAFPSTAKKGQASRIVNKLQGLATDTRMDVDYIVTEYGMVRLRGKSNSERARALIEIAHPNFRDELVKQAESVRLI